MKKVESISETEIANIFEISDRMVYNWIDNFNDNGIIRVNDMHQEKNTNLQEQIMDKDGLMGHFL